MQSTIFTNHTAILSIVVLSYDMRRTRLPVSTQYSSSVTCRTQTHGLLSIPTTGGRKQDHSTRTVPV